MRFFLGEFVLDTFGINFLFDSRWYVQLSNMARLVWWNFRSYLCYHHHRCRLGQMIHWTICFPKANHLGSYDFFFKACGIKYQTLQKGLQDTWGTVSIDCLFFFETNHFDPYLFGSKNTFRNETYVKNIGSNWGKTGLLFSVGKRTANDDATKKRSITVSVYVLVYNDVTGKGPFGQVFLSTPKKVLII